VLSEAGTELTIELSEIDSGHGKRVMSSVLLVRNDPASRKTLANLLARRGHRAISIETIEEAKLLLETESFDLIIADLHLGAATVMDVMTAFRKICIDTEIIIVVSSSQDTALATKVIKKGAYDFIVEPFQNEEILLKIDRALERKRLRKENRLLRQEMAQQLGFDNIIGTSKTITQLKNIVSHIANTDEAVLISGESGTGKELFSRVIHYHSRRRDNPFISINCSATSPEFIESEFFGCVGEDSKSTTVNKRGFFEEADQGTIFLDEITDLSCTVQAKLLHLLRKNEIVPVNSETAKPVDVRIIAATNTDLREQVQTGRFSKELYARLNGMAVHIPPLRERPEDIVPMAEYFLRNIQREYHRLPLSLSPDGLKALLEYHWPGNGRELENTLKRAVALSTEGRIGRKEIVFISPRTVRLVPQPVLSEEKRSLLENQKLQILKSLEDNNWNYSLAASQLGIGRTTLWRKIKKFNLGQTDSAVNRQLTHMGRDF